MTAPTIREANKSETAEFFGVSLPTLENWVRRGCPVLERGGKNVPYRFDLRAVAEWYYGGKSVASDGDVDPEKMTPKERKDWYEGEKVRRALEVDAGKLLRADEAEIEFAAMVKTFAGALEILPFRLERECNLSGDVVERLQIAIDEARESLYRAMVDRGA
jgi:phage terminase Nu1 subunit (DNA packaging protein)